MGSDTNDNDERPQHTVTLPPYFIGRYEVTAGQYKACVRNGGCAPGDQRALAGAEDLPLRWVSWSEALAYCHWLDRKLKGAPATPRPLADGLANGWQITLPSEAEWERAARGTEGRVYPWGSAGADPARANYDRTKTGVVAVGSFPAGQTADGLFDMAGNVSEWTRSVYKAYPYIADDGRERLDERKERVLRGGAFNHPEFNLRAADRYGDDPDYGRSGSVGFRLVSSRLRP